jgi:putative transposase
VWLSGGIRRARHAHVVSKDTAVIEQAYRFALDPTRDQAVVMGSWLGASRFWFNQALAEVRARMDQRARGERVDVPWSYHGLCSVLDAGWRAERAPWQAGLPCGTYMAGFEALGAALRSFTEARKVGRTAGFPKFKRKGRDRESMFFQRPRVLDARHVEFATAHGPVRVKEHMTKLIRLLENDERSRIIRATITRNGHRWYVSFTVRRSPKQRRPRRPSEAVGCDVGLSRQATLHTGQVFANLRPLQRHLSRLRRLQRQLDRQRRANNPQNYLPDGAMKTGAREWMKSRRMLETERRIARVHQRVANIRRERAHLLTTFLTREYAVIGAEALHVKGMLKNKRLARHISDVGWGLILSQLNYKTAWSEGSILALADRFMPSSKTCSACGSVKAKLDLKQRIFSCNECGHVVDRDVNAALNLARLALTEARSRGRTDVVIAVGPQAAAQAARGATDPETRRLQRVGRATAENRTGPCNGPSPADEARRAA